MSKKFLKLKSTDTDARVLVAADAIASVHESENESIITLNSGEELNVKESYQTLVNRLTKDEE